MEIVIEQRRRRSPAARVGSALSSLLMLAVLLVSAGYLVPSLLGYQRYIITGGSMTGTYDRGSIVFEKARPSAALEVGDVITYLPPPSSGVTDLVTHRIVRKTPGADGGFVFRTKGDANPYRDPWKFTLDDTSQPVVTYSVPYVGWVFLFLSDPRHRTWAIGGPAAAVALLSLLQAARNARQERASRANGGAPVPAVQAAPVVPVPVAVPAPAAGSREMELVG